MCVWGGAAGTPVFPFSAAAKAPLWFSHREGTLPHISKRGQKERKKKTTLPCHVTTPFFCFYLAPLCPASGPQPTHAPSCGCLSFHLLLPLPFPASVCKCSCSGKLAVTKRWRCHEYFNPSPCFLTNCGQDAVTCHPLCRSWMRGVG